MAANIETPFLRRSWPWFSGLFLLALLIYWPALRGGLLWDDAAHVTRAELRDLEGLRRIWFEPGATQQYYPVLHTAFWIEQRLWGDAVIGYHLTNVLLHAANACLLAVLVSRLWPRNEVSPQPAAPSAPIPAAAWLAGFLFVAHPVCVESVAWITEQKNTLSTAFYLLGALAFLHFDASRKVSHYAIAFGLYLLALGAKTTTATLPAALLVVVWWRDGRLDWRRVGLPLLPWFAVAIPAGLLTAAVERTTIGADLVVPDLSLIERTLLAGRVLWFYAGKLLLPVELTFFYPLWDAVAEARAWIGYFAAAVIVTAGLWVIRRRTRAPLAIWLMYAGTLFPALGFFKVFPFQFSFVADHFQYLAIPVAMTGVAVFGTAAFARLSPRLRPASSVVAGGLVLVLAMLSRGESGLYVSDEVLFRANIAENPRSWMGYHILAQRVGKSPERRDEAIALFRKAIELNPRGAETYAAFAGLLVLEPGHSEEAIALFETALRLRPTSAEAHNGLANELVAVPGRLDEAIEHYEAALRLRPDFALAEANLAIALAQRPDRQAEALRHFERTLQVLPNYAPARFYLARLLSSLPGRRGDAVGHYEKAIQLRPGAAEAHFELAVVLIDLGRLPEAARHLDEALRLQPNYVAALNLRGVIFAQQGLADPARAAWNRALQISPDFEPARRNLRRLESGSPR